MVFTSLNFLLFFPVVIFIYYILPKKVRWQFLLLVSLFFYINIKPVYALLLVVVSVITYSFALLISKEESETKQERLLYLGIFIIILPLFFFKYYNFINDGIFALLEKWHLRWPLPDISLLLPIGISFYTFMAVGYVIDVYNEEIEAERNFGLVTLFLSFFPLVLSGPIERAPSMLPQFKHKLDFNYKMAVDGFQMMLWGYFMKLVIADRLAISLNPIFSHVDQHSGSTLFLSTLLYPLQVYGDLGGYSLLAIGSASIMGIKVRPNFNRPFFARSMSDFWRRWHMSLINWITDYLYIPLSLSFRSYGVWGIIIALMATFLIAGIWHGAALTFIFWGLLQGFVVSFEALTKKKKSAFEEKYKLNNRVWYITISIIFTYLLFAFSLLFGGAVQTISESFTALNEIFTDNNQLYIEKVTLGYAFIGVIMLIVSEFRDEFFPRRFLLFNNKHIVIRWMSYFFILFIIILTGIFEGSEFIYFKF